MENPFRLILNFVVMVGAVSVAGYIGYRWLEYRKLMNETVDGSTALCPFCGRRHDTDRECDSCGFDRQAVREAGLEDHLGVLKLIRRVHSSLEETYRRSGGRFGILMNLAKLLPDMHLQRWGSRDGLRDESVETSKEHIRALERLSEGLDDYSELTASIESPESGRSVQEILMESFGADQKLATGFQARLQQALLPREINKDIERLDEARDAVVADIEDRL